MKSSNCTYNLILQSNAEDKNRNVMEALIYGLFILNAVFSIFQVAAQTPSVSTHVASKATVEYPA